MSCKKKYPGICKKPATASKNLGIFAGILLALLPKCPFCIMAYSGTLFLCGKDTLVETHQTNYSLISIFFSVFFCSVILAGILLNFRDKRTKYALALAASGILLILHSVMKSGGQELYYAGVLILFFSVWLNGSLFSILRKLKNMIRISPVNAIGNPSP